MKKILSAGIILVLMGCMAQKQGLKPFHLSMLQEADILYIQEDYQGAATIYNHILEANPAHAEANLRAGICRLNIRDEQINALGFLERAKEQNVAEANYYIGVALHYQERFDDALKALSEYQKSDDDAIPEPEVNQWVKMVNGAKNAYENPKNQRLTNLGPQVNSPFPDYVPLISADGNQLYFTSRRADGVSKQLDPNGQFFEDIYRSKRTEKGWSAPVNIGPPVNTQGHDATVALSPSGNKMLIYRTNNALDGGDIYLTELSDKGWSIPVLFSDKINSRYFEPSAAIAADERTIYFASNRPGGYGGKDIYRVVQQPDGSWSYPINLGPQINTSGHEDGPFISADGKTLFFSSTSHGSIGGYDIYRSVLNPETGEWAAPTNLGHPINTVFDDIYLVMEASGERGYYATNRLGGFGGHDIYEVQFGAENAVIVMNGKVVDSNGKPVRASLQVRSELNEEAERYQTNVRTGKFSVVLQPDIPYEMEISGLDFETLKVDLQYQEVFGETITEVHRDFVLRLLDQQTSNEK